MKKSLFDTLTQPSPKALGRACIPMPDIPGHAPGTGTCPTYPRSQK